MNPYCFLETNVIAAMGVQAIFKIDSKSEKIHHVFLDVVRELLEKIKKNKKLAISSSTVLTEISLKLDKIVIDVIEKFKKAYIDIWTSIEKRYILAKIIDELRMQSIENFQELLSYISIPSYDFDKSKKLEEDLVEIKEIKHINKVV